MKAMAILFFRSSMSIGHWAYMVFLTNSTCKEISLYQVWWTCEAKSFHGPTMTTLSFTKDVSQESAGFQWLLCQCSILLPKTSELWRLLHVRVWFPKHCLFSEEKGFVHLVASHSIPDVNLGTLHFKSVSDFGVFSVPYNSIVVIYPTTDFECHLICEQLPL